MAKIDLSKLTPEEKALLADAYDGKTLDLSGIAPDRKELLAQAWDDYAGEQEPEKTLDEQHPDLSWDDRMQFKNLTTGQGFVDALKKKGFEVNPNDSNKIRKPGEKDWKVVDPSSLEFADIGDVAYDIPAAAVESAATIGGGLFGGLPGAMVAGGGTSGALETLRQTLGKMTPDIEQDYDATDIGLSTGLGALAPALFGSGASTKQIIKKAMEKDVSAASLGKSQQGLLRRGYEALKTTGAKDAAAKAKIPKEIAEEFINNPERLDQLMEIEKMSPEEIFDHYRNKVFTDAPEEIRSEVGKQIGDQSKKLDLKNKFNKLQMAKKMQDEIVETQAALDTMKSSKKLRNSGAEKTFIKQNERALKVLKEAYKNTTVALNQTAALDITPVKNVFNAEIERLTSTGEAADIKKADALRKFVSSNMRYDTRDLSSSILNLKQNLLEKSSKLRETNKASASKVYNDAFDALNNAIEDQYPEIRNLMFDYSDAAQAKKVFKKINKSDAPIATLAKKMEGAEKSAPINAAIETIQRLSKDGTVGSDIKENIKDALFYNYLSKKPGDYFPLQNVVSNFAGPTLGFGAIGGLDYATGGEVPNWLYAVPAFYGARNLALSKASTRAGFRDLFGESRNLPNAWQSMSGRVAPFINKGIVEGAE